MPSEGNEAYRDDLAAAQRRIAQLEEQLAELQQTPELELARLARERALLEVDLARSPGFQPRLLAAAMLLVAIAAAITAATLSMGGKVNAAAFFVLPVLLLLTVTQYRTMRRRQAATRRAARIEAIEALLRTKVVGAAGMTERVRVAETALASEPLTDEDDNCAPLEARGAPPPR